MTEPVPDVPPAVTATVLCAAWATPADVPEPHRAELSNEEWDELLLAASELLWALSGRQWYGGGCTETAVFRGACYCCGQRVAHDDGTYWWVPGSGQVWDSAHPTGLKLPRTNVTVTSVTVGGVAYADYLVDRAAGMLYRADGCGWDTCGEEIGVTYTHGSPATRSAVNAVVALAVEFMKAQLGHQDCKLPQRTVSITRQGISMELLDPMDFLADGRTGVYAVDLWLAAVNPAKLAQRASAWSPDLRRARRTAP